MKVLRTLLSCFLFVATMPSIAQKATLTQNVDEKGRVPYQQAFLLVSCNGSCATPVTVPAGQRLVITNVSGQLLPGGLGATSDMAAGVTVLGSSSLPTANSQPPQLFLPMTRVGTKFMVNSQVTFYQDAGPQPITVTGSLDSSSEHVTFWITISGYLVPLPTGTTPS